MYCYNIMNTNDSVLGHHLTALADSLLLGVDDSFRIEDADAEVCL